MSYAVDEGVKLENIFTFHNISFSPIVAILW
jgi:hypothetical protein